MRMGKTIRPPKVAAIIGITLKCGDALKLGGGHELELGTIHGGVRAEFVLRGENPRSRIVVDRCNETHPNFSASASHGSRLAVRNGDLVLADYVVLIDSSSAVNLRPPSKVMA